MRLLRAFAALALAAPLAAALPKITRQGKYLYDESGDRFYIKGVAYQPQGELAESTEANEENGGFPEPSSYIDPLSSPANCSRDAPYLKQLGVNAVRVYSVNPRLNHDACMAHFNQAGIYVLLDVSLPLNGSIDRSSPAWTTNLMNEYLTTINVFSAYDNILGYNIGNEVVTQWDNTNSLPFVKAAARDVKAYLKSIKSNALVGYAATDGADQFRTTVAEYLACGNETESIDIFGLNNYAWCGDSSYTGSGWNNVVQDYSHMNIPVYMSEFGCIRSLPRLFTEVEALYSSPMTDVFSGGMAFSYFPANDGPYALVDVSSDGKVTTNDDFNRLATQYNATKPPNSPSQSNASAVPAVDCPAESSNFLASAKLPPTPNQAICQCVNDKSLGCHAREAIASEPVKLGKLIDTTCSMLGSINATATCAKFIGGNGTTGEYGQLSMCSPEIKLNWAMSAYWLATELKAESCDFSGNATLINNGPKSAEDANTKAEQCLSGNVAVSTPTATNAPAGPAETDPSKVTHTAEPPSATKSDAATTTAGGKNSAASLAPSALFGVVALALGLAL